MLGSVTYLTTIWGGFAARPKKSPGQLALSESLLNITDLASASKTSQPHAEF